MLYSIYRQRRLITLASVLPAISAYFAMSGSAAMATGAICAVAFSWLLGRWPASHLETMGYSLATAALMPVLAFANSLVVSSTTGANELAILWLYLLIAVTWFFAGLGATRLVCALDLIPAGQTERFGETFIDLAPDLAADALLPAPGKHMANRTCGPKQEDDYFEVSFEVDGVDPIDYSEIRIRHVYSARIMESEHIKGYVRQVTQTVLANLDPPRSSVIEQTFTEEGSGTRYRFHEVHDLFSVLSLALFWLQDAEEDHFQAEIDGYLGRPVQSCILGSQVSLLTLMARWFVDNGYAPKNDPDA